MKHRHIQLLGSTFPGEDTTVFQLCGKSTVSPRCEKDPTVAALERNSDTEVPRFAVVGFDQLSDDTAARTFHADLKSPLQKKLR